MNQSFDIELIQQQALLYLLKFLREQYYQFTVITPLSHLRIYNRKMNESSDQRSLQDIFGWNLAFTSTCLNKQVFSILKNAQIIRIENNQFYSNVRVASIDNQLFIHSAFPTIEKDAVFLGPDTYRFYYHLKQYLLNHVQPITRGLELCCGTSAVAISIAQSFPNIAEIYTADINPKALFYSRLNKIFNAAKRISPLYSDLFSGLEGNFDLIFANPPYLIDSQERQYRHGGNQLNGMELAFKILKAGIERLTPQGTLFLYSGMPISPQGNQFLEAVQEWIQFYPGFEYCYEEVDPDVFGEELDQMAYRHVERIAVGLIKISAI